MVYQRIYRIIIISLSLLILFAACDYKNDSYGNFDEIMVFADTSLFRNVRAQVEQVFDRFLYTPHVERSFLLKFQGYEQLGIFQMRRNLLFLAILGGDDQVSQYISNALSEDVKQAIRDGQIFHIFKKNLYAEDQLAIILCARSEDDLKERLIRFSDQIYTEFESYHYERLEKIMFLRAEQTLLEEYFYNTMGWSMRIQHDYFVAEESPDSNFVWLRRLKPDRSIFVFREKAAAMPEGVNWLIQLRDSLTTVHFEGDSVDTDDTYIKKITFNKKPAYQMIGVWQNHQLLIGGPFRTYALYDDQNGFIYLIDYQVTAPGKRKKPFLDQLEVMARTFRIRT